MKSRFSIGAAAAAAALTTGLVLSGGGAANAAPTAVAKPASVGFGTTPNCKGDANQTLYSSPWTYSIWVRQPNKRFYGTLFTWSLGGYKASAHYWAC